MANVHSFIGKKSPFAVDLLSVGLTEKTSDGAVLADDTVTGDIRSKGVPAKGLSHRLRTAAANACRQLAVGDGLSGRNVQQLEVDLALKFADGSAFLHFVSDVINVRVHVL